VTKSTIKSTSSCFIQRRDQEVTISLTHPTNLPEVRLLLHLQVIEGHFAVSPVFPPSGGRSPSYEKAWLVVRSLNSSKGYQITEGDVLKMGRLKFRVKELKGADPSKRVKDFQLSDLIAFRDDESDDSESEDCNKFSLPCRICLSEKYKDDNPLICPCNCDGTMKYIHLRCLQRALRSKVTTRASESTLSFSWKVMSCDLCKKPYPYRFILGDQNIELIQIPKPPEKFIILEGLCKDKNSSKWLHVICLNSKDSIRLGRANECELRMTDISVSRMHGNIKLVGENFYLEDKGSKFGTLVQIKRPVALDPSNELSIQTGRSLLTLSIKKPWSLIPACFRSSSSPYDLLSSPYTEGVVPLLPINTGIPLSINDAEELLARAGINKCRSEKYKNNDNLLFEHGQLGANSSLEDEGIDGVEPVQAIEVAAEENAEPLPQENISDDIGEHRRSHSFV
jgi:hypothetical protein